MSVLVDQNTRVVVQGITGRDGSFHARGMLEYGTRVVAGVTPGKGGARFDDRVPVFDTVREAVAQTGADATVIYVPAPFAADAVLEAARAEVALIVCITEGVPVGDMVRVMAVIGDGPSRLIGPNCPGLVSPGKAKLGIMPGFIHAPGRVGLVSRSGTLTYEVVKTMTDAGIGQSTCVGIGGDPIVGTRFTDVLELMNADPDTDAVVLIGEIGGADEEEAAVFIRERVRKPVVAFIAGRSAPPGRRMGHAGAIVSGSSGTAEGKIAALEEAGVPVARVPAEIAEHLQEALGSRTGG